jgi:predicted acetyltransferase
MPQLRTSITENTSKVYKLSGMDSRFFELDLLASSDNPEYRGQGIAGGLLKKVLSDLQPHGVTFVCPSKYAQDMYEKIDGIKILKSVPFTFNINGNKYTEQIKSYAIEPKESKKKSNPTIISNTTSSEILRNLKSSRVTL